MAYTQLAVLLGVAVLCAPVLRALQRPLHEDVQRIYNFRPHLLTDEQRKAKSAVMDQFWDKVKTGKDYLLPALRSELTDLSNPPFFLYDGSMLLLSLSDTGGDRKLALAAISKCDLLDVQTNSYFKQVHHIAGLNEDTSSAALHILDDQAFAVSVPQHALTLGHVGLHASPGGRKVLDSSGDRQAKDRRGSDRTEKFAVAALVRPDAGGRQSTF